MRRNGILAAAAGALLAALPSLSFAAGGADPFAFLLLPTDARSVGLGGAHTAVVDDSNALFQNPGALAGAERHNASFMHNQHFEGASQEVLSVGFKNGWALGVDYLDYGDIPRTTVGNPSGTGLGNFGAKSMALAGGYGRRMNAFLTLGAALKFVQEEIAGFKGAGAAADLGGRIELGNLREEFPLTLGWSLQNFGLTKPKFNSKREDFPATLRLGAAYALSFGEQKLTGAVDLVRADGDDFTIHPGLEWAPVPMFAARVGFDGRNDAGTGISGGAAWRFKDASLDYGFTPFGDLGNAHRFSVTVKFGEARGSWSTTKMPQKPRESESIWERDPKVMWGGEEKKPDRPQLPQRRIRRPDYFDSDKTIGL